MNKRITKLILALFICTICLAGLAPRVKASGVSSGEIPVTINLGDSIGKLDDEFEIEFRAEFPSNPMPEGSKDGVYSILITGDEKSVLPKIDYTMVGEYTYTISQKIDKEHSSDYDRNTYILNVKVIRSQTSEGLQAVSTMYLLGQSEKVAGAVFYNAPPPPSIEPTPAPTEKPTQVPNPVTPKTGDETNVWPYIILFAGGAGILIFLGLTTSNKNNKTIQD